MDAARLTRERVIALAFVLLNMIAAFFWSRLPGSRLAVLGAAFLLSIPGLVMIWFRESLSVTGFDRGVLRESPPLMIDVLGWLFLVGLPILFLYGLLP